MVWSIIELNFKLITQLNYFIDQSESVDLRVRRVKKEVIDNTVVSDESLDANKVVTNKK